MNEILNPFQAIYEKLEGIEALLSRSNHVETTPIYLTIQKAADFLGKSANALRVMVHKNQIQHIKKQGKFFLKPLF